MNQSQTPLFDAMSAFHKKCPISLHVPGHKNGQVFNKKGQALYNPLLGIDATEISGLDDLHAPEGAILKSEQLLADLYGVKRSYFLVNGVNRRQHCDDSCYLPGKVIRSLSKKLP